MALVASSALTVGIACRNEQVFGDPIPGAFPTGEVTASTALGLTSPTWTETTPMNFARQDNIMVLLPSGSVLVAGGHSGNFVSTATAETYNQATRAWTTVASLGTARRDFGGCLLTSGVVLVAGGRNDATQTTLASAEVYNPSTGTWSATGSLATARENHQLTCLPDGRALATGGINAAGALLGTAEVYDPVSGTWSSTGTIPFAVHAHRTVVLNDGRVLFVGGASASPAVASAAIWNPTNGTWSSTGSMTTARSFHTLHLLNDGRVLAAGGLGVSLAATNTAEIYNPSTGTWSAAPNLTSARYSSAGVTVATGPLVVGGYNGFSSLASSESYDVAHNAWAQIATGNQAANETAVALSPTTVIAAGGYVGGSAATADAQIYVSPTISCQYALPDGGATGGKALMNVGTPADGGAFLSQISAYAQYHAGGFVYTNMYTDGVSGNVPDDVLNGGVNRMSPADKSALQNLLSAAVASGSAGCVTDGFIRMDFDVDVVGADAGYRYVFDIFDPGQVSSFQKSFANQAAFARAAGLKGIWLDAEPYDYGCAWKEEVVEPADAGVSCPAVTAQGKSEADVAAQYFHLGQLAMQAMTAEYPDIQLIMAPAFGYDQNVYVHYPDFYAGLIAVASAVKAHGVVLATEATYGVYEQPNMGGVYCYEMGTCAIGEAPDGAQIYSPVVPTLQSYSRDGGPDLWGWHLANSSVALASWPYADNGEYQRLWPYTDGGPALADFKIAVQNSYADCPKYFWIYDEANNWSRSSYACDPEAGAVPDGSTLNDAGQVVTNLACPGLVMQAALPPLVQSP